MKKIMVTRSSMPPYEEFIKAIKPLWDSRWLTNMGSYHQQLEKELIKILQTPQISLFTNGHLALELTIQAMKLKGEVITTPFTFASTTHAIVRNGLKPVFCDIDPNTYTIDASKIEDLITENTSAIVPVHVYGNVCDMDKIEEIANRHRLKVIYDAAHAFGVRYKGRGVGEFGDASMFSFHATKVFNTIEGGAVCFKNEEFGTYLYKLKNFGIRDEETVDGVGSNAKMNEFQAIMGLCNLKHLEDELLKRKNIVDLYRRRLNGINGIKISEAQKDVIENYAYFPVIITEESRNDRNAIHEKLMEKNIFTRKYFYPLTNVFQCYEGQFDSNRTPIALEISGRILTLPLYADLEPEDVNHICDNLIELVRGGDGERR